MADEFLLVEMETKISERILLVGQSVTLLTHVGLLVGGVNEVGEGPGSPNPDLITPVGLLNGNGTKYANTERVPESLCFHQNLKNNLKSLFVYEIYEIYKMF